MQKEKIFIKIILFSFIFLNIGCNKTKSKEISKEKIYPFAKLVMIKPYFQRNTFQIILKAEGKYFNVTQFSNNLPIKDSYNLRIVEKQNCSDCEIYKEYYIDGDSGY